MGTSQMFSALAEGHGNLNDKILNFVALCPIINLGWSTDEVIVYGANDYNLVNTMFNDLHIDEIPAPAHISEEMYNAVCAIIPCSIFGNVLKDLFGYNSPFDRNDRA